ncbi:MAG: hypothetical protein ACYDAO_01330 [Thermoplasmataceae archaeon]
MSEELRSFLYRYIRDIEPIRNYNRKILIDEKYPGYVGSKFIYEYSPLNIDQIAINSGSKIGDVLMVLSDMNIGLDKSIESEDKISELEFDLMDQIELKEPITIDLKECTNEELIILAIYKNICGNLTSPSDLFSTIFHVKNSMGLPDDFMPGRFINLGERPDIFSVKILQESSFVKNIRALYFFSPIKSGTVFAPFSIYPSISSLKITEETDFIIQTIKDSFKKFQDSPIFNKYVNYRALKNFSKKLKMRKNGIINSNFLSSQECAEAMKTGIIENKDNNFYLKEDFFISDLNDLIDARKGEGSEAGKEWLMEQPLL